jgi:hypothetical protein
MYLCQVLVENDGSIRRHGLLVLLPILQDVVDQVCVALEKVDVPEDVLGKLTY